MDVTLDYNIIDNINGDNVQKVAQVNADLDMANDEAVKKIIHQVRNFEVDIIDGKADISEKETERGIEDKMRSINTVAFIRDVDVENLVVEIKDRHHYKTKATAQKKTIIKPKTAPEGVQNPELGMTIDASAFHQLFDLREHQQLFKDLKSILNQETAGLIDWMVERINNGDIPFGEKGIVLDEPTLAKQLFMALLAKSDTKVSRPTAVDLIKIDTHLKWDSVKESDMKMWEVFFDYKDEKTGRGRRIDPIILDLNRDGKFDITGANQKGNGKIDGDTVRFDIDPSRQSWSKNSPGHRPGWYEGRPSPLIDPIPGGKAVYNTGKKTSVNLASGKTTPNSDIQPKYSMPRANGLESGSPPIGAGHMAGA